MSILLWIVFGALVGFIADYIDTSVKLGWIERMVVGIVGAVVGGSLAAIITTGTLNLTTAGGFDLISIVVSVAGSLLALFVWKRVAGHRTAV